MMNNLQCEYQSHVVVCLFLVCSLSMFFGGIYIYSNQKHEYDSNSEIIQRECHKVKKRKRRKKEHTIRRSHIAHPTTSDKGCPTLSTPITDTSTLSSGSNADYHDQENKITVSRPVPRRAKRRVVQESLTFSSVRENECVQACLGEYEEDEVETAFKYLTKRGLFRNDAKYLSDAIQHLESLKEKNRDTDYTEADLADLLDGDRCLENIPIFKQKYGFLPTPEELINFETEKDRKNSSTQKNARLVKNYKRLALKDKEMQKKMKQMETEKSFLSQKCSLLQNRNEKLSIEVMRAKCKICKDNEIGAIVLPCDHAFCCAVCAKTLYVRRRGPRARETCVICNVKVTSFRLFYLS